ncbi:MAG: hypothetical protein U0570_08495 [Phycisphaerales bacterium]
MAQTIVLLLIAYLLAGMVFAFYFFFWGAVRLNARARGASAGTKLLWMPGAAGLWPYLSYLLIQRRVEGVDR